MDELRQQLGAMHSATMAQLNYAKTLILLRALKSGAVMLEQVVLDGDNWSVFDAPEPAKVPADNDD